MLNSKYAPLVAVTVVIGLILGLIGYFTLVKPAADQGSVYRSDRGKVQQNTKTIKQEVEKLEEAQIAFAELPDIDSVIAANMPKTFDPAALERRILDLVASSGVEIVSYAQGGARSFEPWEIDARSLPSSRIAKLFETKELTPASIGRSRDSADEQATPSTNSKVVYNGVGLVPLTVEVAGNPAEIDAFLSSLQNSGDPLLLIYSMSLEARPLGSEQDGIRTALPNDAIAKVVLAQYVYELERTEQVDRIPDTNLPNSGNVSSR